MSPGLLGIPCDFFSPCVREGHRGAQAWREIQPFGPMSLEEPILRCPSNHAKAAGQVRKAWRSSPPLHGIWAFKVSATGERTDLVPGEKLEITPQVEAASEALVLTDWKCVRKPGECRRGVPFIEAGGGSD